MGAAGAVELAACLACMEAGILPATPGFRTHAPECAGVRVLLAPEQREVRRVLKWSFGFGGHLAAVALERL